MLKTFMALAVALLFLSHAPAAVAQQTAQDVVQSVIVPAVPEHEMLAQATPAEAPTPVATSGGGIDFTPVVKVILDTLAASLLAILTAAAAWLTAQVSKWTSGRIALNDVMRDIEMERYARGAIDKAMNYAMRKAGVTWDALADVRFKSQVLQYGTDFLVSQYPEVVKWIDKDANGVIDWVETHLPVYAPPADEAAPQAFTTAAKAPRKPRPIQPANPQPASAISMPDKI